jgi:hypothetical protein
VVLMVETTSSSSLCDPIFIATLESPNVFGLSLRRGLSL